MSWWENDAVEPWDDEDIFDMFFPDLSPFEIEEALENRIPE